MFRGKRAFLADFLFHSKAYLALRHFEPRSLVIFNYHRIRSGESDSFPFDEGVYGPDQETLRAHFRWLKLNADIISEQELLEHVRGRRKLPKSSVMVTFDDGYRDNAELALPIIREEGIPVTFFIATEAVNSRGIGWWDSIAYLIKRTQHAQICLRGKTFDFGSGKKGAIAELQHWMRTLQTEKTRTLIEEIAHACEVSMPDRETRSRELMSWDQIREAAESGVAIGSHTHTHRALSTLSLSQQYQEFLNSKAILERELNRPIRSVAYPIGNSCDYRPEAERLAEISGYELAFSFQTGANRLDRMNPFGIGRISAEDSIPLTCAAVTLPSVFARSRSPKGLAAPI